MNFSTFSDFSWYRNLRLCGFSIKRAVIERKSLGKNHENSHLTKKRVFIIIAVRQNPRRKTQLWW